MSDVYPIARILTIFLQPRGPTRRMLNVPMRSFAIALLAAFSSGCSTANPPPPEAGAAEPPVHAEPDTTESPEPIDPQFTETMRRAAAEYQEWGRVDERPNIAPMLCRAPSGIDYGFPSHARRSTADDGPHGQKLYYLFAGLDKSTGRWLYSSLGTPEAQEIPVGFTIVKQSWHAVPSEQPTPKEPVPVAQKDTMMETPSPISWVVHDGQRLDVGEQAELFVMAKVGAPDMPGTDKGWVYGTLDAQAKTVTSAGLVQRCMDCHEAAEHERLFGLQTTKAFATVKPAMYDVPGTDPVPTSLGLEP